MESAKFKHPSSYSHCPYCGRFLIGPKVRINDFAFHLDCIRVELERRATALNEKWPESLLTKREEFVE